MEILNEDEEDRFGGNFMNDHGFHSHSIGLRKSNENLDEHHDSLNKQAFFDNIYWKNHDVIVDEVEL